MNKLSAELAGVLALSAASLAGAAEKPGELAPVWTGHLA
jgi:hypothetical protein